MYDFSKVVITSSPHIKSKEDTKSIMLDVLLALIPSLAVSTYVFGLRAILMTAVSIIACMVFEAIYDKIVGKENTVMDLSAAVTGVLLAFVCPVTLPYWMLIIGDGIAIIFAKCIFGGLGKNFINPALAGRAFLLASYPTEMTTWVVPNGLAADAATYATPLAQLKNGALDASLKQLVMGQVGGTIGETCAIALIIGGIYLLYKHVISWKIPVIYIATVFILFAVIGRHGMRMPLQEIFAGGVMLGGIFMATDYASSPVTPKGQVIFAVGAGLLTYLIRTFGGYPEGVSYSILIMNCCVPLIERFTEPTIFGALPKTKEAK